MPTVKNTGVNSQILRHLILNSKSLPIPQFSTMNQSPAFTEPGEEITHVSTLNDVGNESVG